MSAGVYRVSVDTPHGATAGNVTLTTLGDLTDHLKSVLGDGLLPDQIVVARLYDVSTYPERVD